MTLLAPITMDGGTEMDLKLFRNFIEIVEAGSLSAAAKTLYVAQPALTNQLHILEREFGAPLLTRSSRR